MRQHYIHVAGKAFLVSPSFIFRRAVRVMRDVEKDVLLRRALENRAVQTLDRLQRVRANSWLAGLYWRDMDARIHVLETRVVPVLGAAPDTSVGSWYGRLMLGHNPLPDPRDGDLDMLACQVMRDMWLDTSEWRARRIAPVSMAREWGRE
ncbi:MAG: hypothetical protein H6922_02000 [Pseudomonadaceae bacterium]|nr:hypothetical protein [Pseudomonadaceae bacterium]